MNTKKINRQNVKMIAHRGVSGLETENTCAAFVAAGNRSYFGIETDVHKTSDGHFVIIHDDSTTRVSGVEHTVEETDFATLRALQLFNKEGVPARKDICIPTLEEYASICLHYEKVGILELKNTFSKEEIGQIVTILKEQNALDAIIFISFYYSNLVYVREFLPDAKVQFLCGTPTEEQMEAMIRDKFDLDINYKCLTPEILQRMHDNGRVVNVWTVDDPAVAEELVALGVDFITSNICE